jgi:hypothetical protein
MADPHTVTDFRSMTPHHFAQALPRTSVFQIKANGQPLDVLHHISADFTSFESAGPVHIEIALPSAPEQAIVRPLHRGITAKLSGNTVEFSIPGPQYLQIEIPGFPLLYIYALPLALEPPSDRNIKRFAGGEIHDAGQIELSDGDVCWFDPGAYVRGNIRVENSSNILIGGYGILEGGIWPERGESRRKAIVFDHCKDCRVENLLMLSPSSWMVVLGGCRDMEVNGVRQIADHYGSDGVDIVGSQRIRITGCMLHNGDDNIAIKAIFQNPTGTNGADAFAGKGHGIWNQDVEDVEVSACAFYNTHGGSAMEIGYETSTDRIRNIRFEDIDVIAVHNFGSVFGIHTGDRAVVENITWENIRVEHHYDKLVDFRIVWSRWNRDAERGIVRGVRFRNIRVSQIPPNVGYTISVIAGFDADHPVQDVVFENFLLGGVHVKNPDQLDLVTRHALDLQFH